MNTETPNQSLKLKTPSGELRCIARLDKNPLFQCTKAVPPFTGPNRKNPSGRTWATCTAHQTFKLGPYYKLSKGQLSNLQTASKPLTNSDLKKHFQEIYSSKDDKPVPYNKTGSIRPYTKNVFDHLVKISNMSKSQRKEFKRLYPTAFTEERGY